MNLVSLYNKIDRLLVTLGGWLQPVLLLGIRLYWGWQFFVTGKAKFMDIPTFVDRFTSWGVPLPRVNVYMAGATECVGGLLLLAGLFSRAASVSLIFTMLVAFATAHRGVTKDILANPDNFVSAAPFLFLLASVLVFAFGPGKLSLDALLRKKE